MHLRHQQAEQLRHPRKSGALHELQLHCQPAQSWRVPAASRMSGLITAMMALPMIRLTVSPTLMGLMPGHLSRAIKRLAVSGASASRSTYDVHSFLATRARLLYSSAEWF